MIYMFLFFVFYKLYIDYYLDIAVDICEYIFDMYVILITVRLAFTY